MRLCLKQNKPLWGWFSHRKIWLHMGEERTGNQDGRREEKELPQYHSARMPTSACKTGRTVLLLSVFFPTRD